MYGFLAEDMNNHLFEGNYAESMNLIGGYYNAEYVYEQKLGDKTGFVLFEATTLSNTKEDDLNGNNKNQMNQVYAGFFYGLKDNYKYTLKDKTIENQAVVLVDNGTTKLPIKILNYDTDNNDSLDSINTMENFDYIYVEFPKSELEQIQAIELIDAKGNSYWKSETLDLKYDTEFFTLTQPFISIYNENNESNKLIDLETTILNRYQRGNFGDAQSRATKRACIVVLIYFICVYIIADFLVGKHFIIRFSIYLFHKIKKDKKKDQESDTSEVYGSDYFTKLTIRLISDDEIEGNIQLHYHNENEEINMLFTKDNQYCETQRIHAGEYLNGRLECPGYEAIDFNDIIKVSSYQMEVEIKIEKIKEAPEESI